MKSKKQNHIPPAKKEIVHELSDLIKNKKTILIASIEDIPSSQFQEIVKKLRGRAIVKVPKKNLIFRAIDSSGDEAVKKLKEHFQNSVAILFSDLDCFELALDLEKSKRPAKAKAGQEAPEDIEIDAGPTDLVPGPAISELGAVGIQIQIEKGKIHIKKSKVIVKQGEKISARAADVMSKLDIKPFSIGFIPLSAFDTKEGKLYLEIKINKEGTIEELKSAYSKALPFAVEIGYSTEDTIKFLIGKAGMHEKALDKFAEAESLEDKEIDNEKDSEGKISNEGEQSDDESESKKNDKLKPDEKVEQSKNDELTDKKNLEPKDEIKEDIQEDKSGEEIKDE